MSQACLPHVIVFSIRKAFVFLILLLFISVAV